MRIEVLGNKLKDDGYDLVQGDTITVHDAIGARWCGFGWAKDVDGNVPTGERKPGAQRINAQNAKARVS